MAGFADSPIAITPFGSGTPVATVAPPTKPPERAAYIDPTTRDYVFDSEGELARMPEVRQQMLLAVMTLLGSSSSEPQRGIRAPGKVDENIGAAMRGSVVAATAHIVAAKRASLDDVIVDVVSMGRVRTTIVYTDLVSGETNRIVVGAPGEAAPVTGATLLTPSGDTLTTSSGDTLVLS